jgi:hypothetical protein
MRFERPLQFSPAENSEPQEIKPVDQSSEITSIAPLVEPKERRAIKELEDQVVIKANASEDATKEKIALIEKLYAINYTPEEKKAFDDWLAQMPESSAEKSIIVYSIEDVVKFLPQSGNYRGERINLFFRKEGSFSPDELKAIFEIFSQDNPSFEISVVRHNNDIISVGIGDKVRNNSTIFDGEYFGHYHPNQFKLEKEDILPNCFVKGLMPSAGDLKGFFKHFESVKEGTRIFSKYGYVLIKPIEPMLKTENINKALNEFSQKYFDLFLGLNKFDFKSDKEVSNYFRSSFGFDLEFHYSKQD